MENQKEQIFIHTGTQTGSMIGFKGPIDSMESAYAYSPNLIQGSIKCVSASGRFLFTGGFDEIIRIYDIRKGKENGQLIGHEGTITCIKHYQNFLMTGAQDHMIIIWKKKEWSLLHRLKGHKDTVYDLSIHSSGKIMASVGKDKKLILWNLVNGTKLFRKTFPFEMYKVDWSPSEEHILIMSDFSVHLVSQETNKPVKELKHPKRINDFTKFDDALIVGGDDGYIYVWHNAFDLEAESHYFAFKAHTPRVKRLSCIVVSGVQYLISCSTDGQISIWDLENILTHRDNTNIFDDSVVPKESIFTYQRIISLFVHTFIPSPPKKENANSDKIKVEKVEEKIEYVENGDDDVPKLDKKSKKIKKLKVTFQEPPKTAKKKNKSK